MTAAGPGSARPASKRIGIGSQLFLGAAAIVGLGAATSWIVAWAIGPGVFHQHMAAAGLGANSGAALHAEQAFRSASGTSLGLAIGVSLMATLLVIVVFGRRITRPLSDLSTAASRTAAGRFDTRVTRPGLSREFDELAVAFNAMAARLGQDQELRHRLLADVAHELRTPVATIAAYVEGLEDGVVALDAETAEILRLQTARLTRLAQDLAAVTQAEEAIERLHTEPVAASRLIEDALGSATESFRAAAVDLRSEVAEPVGAVVLEVDRTRIAQVLANLLDNAVRHTPPGGSVTVAAQLDDAVAADDAGSGRVIRIAVADTGDGITPEHLPHVFERFYRAEAARDRASGGSGIGLALVKAYVEAHGGHVAATSPGTGSGSRFTITLPIRWLDQRGWAAVVAAGGSIAGSVSPPT
jgi:signal transduction histidine kinase